MRTGGLGAIQRDQHGDGGIERLGPKDGVELVIIIAEHIQIQRDGGAGQDILQYIVNVIPADIE